MGKTKTSRNAMQQQPTPTICLIPGLDQTELIASISNPKDIIAAASSVALSSSFASEGSSSASVSSTGSGSSGSGVIPKDIMASLDDSNRRVYNKDGTKIRKSATKTVVTSLDDSASRRVYNKDGTKIRTPTKTVSDVLGRKEI